MKYASEIARKNAGPPSSLLNVRRSGETHSRPDFLAVVAYISPALWILRQFRPSGFMRRRTEITARG